MAAPSPTAEASQQVPPSPSAPTPPEHTENDFDIRRVHPSRTPSTSSVEYPLLPDGQPRTPRVLAVTPNFVSSPLNPNAPVHPSAPPSLFNGSRTQSRQSVVFNRIATEESQALTSHRTSLTPNRTSMILYRLADEKDQHTLSPPGVNRRSVLSNSGDSTLTVSYDSKYPSGAHTPPKLIAYPFDPNSHVDTPEDDDALHDPSDNSLEAPSRIALRGFVNVGVLVLVIVSLLFLFIFYPVWHYTVQGNSTVP